MNKWLPRVLGLVLGLVMILAGTSFHWGQDKAKPRVVIPEADEVAKITFKAEKRLAGGPFELNLTKPEEFKPLLKFLKDVGWDDAKSGDARVIRFAPAAFIEIDLKNKTNLNFTVAESLIVSGDRYWPIEKKNLEAAVKQVKAGGK